MLDSLELQAKILLMEGWEVAHTGSQMVVSSWKYVRRQVAVSIHRVGGMFGWDFCRFSSPCSLSHEDPRRAAAKLRSQMSMGTGVSFGTMWLYVGTHP